MLADVASGRADVVIAWALDRLTRNRRDTVRLIEACQDAGVSIALVRGSDIDMTSPSGRLVADVLASVARAEIETKGDRQKRANDQRAAQGRPIAGGARPFGYESGGMKTRESEAVLVREAYASILAGGALRSIARTWNDAGARTSRGNTWDGPTVRLRLLSPRYAALRMHRGEIVGAAAWEPIVSEATWRAAMHVLSDPQRSTVKERSIKYMLTGILTCGRCGEYMATAHTARGSRLYKCKNSDTARNAEQLDDLVTAVVLERLRRPDAADLAAPSQGVDVGSLRTDAQALRTQLDEAAALFAAGSIRASQLATITTRIEDRLRVIESELEAAGRADAVTSVLGERDVQATWDDLDVMRRRAVIKALFSRVTVLPVAKGTRTLQPEHVTIEWRTA